MLPAQAKYCAKSRTTNKKVVVLWERVGQGPRKARFGHMWKICHHFGMSDMICSSTRLCVAALAGRAIIIQSTL
jgi:hypothetical protein